MTARVAMNRRELLVSLHLAAGGLALGFLPRKALAQSSVQTSVDGFDPHVLVHIALDGLVTITCHRSEMGQGVRSSLPALIADELGASDERIVVKQALGDKKYGDQNTDGSTSIRKSYDKLRQAGAVARTMLITTAANEWKVNPKTCITKNHSVIHVASGKSVAFGDLVEKASKLQVPDPATMKLRPEKDLIRVLSKKIPLLDGADIVSGRAQFGADVKLPDMVVAVIARPPVVGGSLKSYDAAQTLRIPGVLRVIAMPAPGKPWKFQPWGGVAVVAQNTWAALRGRDALQITWEDGENGDYQSTNFMEEQLASVRSPGTVCRKVGDVDQALAKSAKVVTAEYLVPHLSHMQMEPLVATAHVKGDVCEIWAPTQHPQSAQDEVGKLLKIDPAKVIVHVTLLGGGFGRKSKPDFICEAAWLSREMGKPVRVQWTRQDDVQHGYYNAVSVQRLQAGLDEAGKVLAWHHRTSFPPIGNTFSKDVSGPGNGDLQQGVLDLALHVPNVQAEACAAKAHNRVGWYRSVYNIFHAFAVGSFIDEIAEARKRDPRDTWLEILGPAREVNLKELGIEDLPNYGQDLKMHPVDAGRLRNVITRVTAAAQWDKRKANGRFLGLAAHRSFLSYTAVVVSVVADPKKKFRIDEAWISMDAGKVVNQDRVHSQMEGAVVMGISNAMFGGITMKQGRAEQSNFRDARIARISDVPRTIHTDIVPSDRPPGGVGEPGVPPVSAALGNAIFALTGERMRAIPFVRFSA